jgi:single-strand DNA-binding protein
MYNKVVLAGRLGADAEHVTFQNGGSVAKLRLATTRSYKSKEGDWVEKTSWHNVVLRNPSEKLVKVLTKGTPVLVEGELETRSYDDANGNKVYVTEVLVNTGGITLLPGGGNSNGNGNGRKAAKPQPQVADVADVSEADIEDIPF